MRTEPESAKPKVKVAVLGGGCGAMAAAFYLRSTPELRARYEVTVYQQGWRLGGKGATGRDSRAGYGQRIYEHGLHMWLGWYHNAFHLIQQVYAEWEKKPENPYPTWQDAFAPQRQFSFQQDIPLSGGGTRWRTRMIPMPRLPGTPGEGSGALPGPMGFLARTLEQLTPVFRGSAFFDPGQISIASEGSAVSLLELACRAAQQLNETGNDGEKQHALAEVERHLSIFQHWLHSESALETMAIGDNARWIWQFLDFSAAVALGLARDVIPHGVASINHLNFHEWLVRHGASEGTRWSAFSRAIYDLAFAFEGGRADMEHARYEAGSALMVYLRVALGYKDAPMFRMMAGMGDTIFSPIYEVLAKQRAVKFEFFKRVSHLALSADGKRIEAIKLDVQAVVEAGPAAYEPLYNLTFDDGTALPVWPDEPRWDQLQGGAELKRRMPPGRSFESAWCDLRVGEQTLTRGVDFDAVVLGISLGGLRAITPELAAASPGWRTMLDRVATVETQALQLWTNPDLEGLGWEEGSTIQTAYAEPVDTWADMTEVLSRETWGNASRPGGLHYFCGPRECPPEAPLRDPDYPEASASAVKSGMTTWLDENIGHIWPRAVDANGSFDTGVLHDPENADGAARIDSQYWRANIDPSERYVNSLPGTTLARLRAEDSGFENLFLAGDWTISSVNGGCVEAAVESGMAASRAICGVPETIPNYPEK